MSNDELLTDDYVAGLLAKEASDCSLKYSAMGLEAFNTKKKPANSLKPNTRFLRHIIKDTDAHNKALLAKEAAESKARLKDLERTEEIKRIKKNPNARDIRRRQMGDIQAILGKKPKRRPSVDGDGAGAGARPSGSRSTVDKAAQRDSKRSHDLLRDSHEERRHYGRLGRSERDRDDDDDKQRGDGERRSRKTRDRDSSPEEHDSRSHRRSRRDRSRSPERRRRSRSPGEKRRRHRERSPRRSPHRSAKESSTRDLKDNQKGDDSDPLDDFIGPAPPPVYRGRGKVSGSAGIDRRFSESYDPKTDVYMDEEDTGGNWDDAVEAFRDRQKLRSAQEERLKSAGFTESQIPKMSGTVEGEDENVVWAKAGEKRQWDRGKVPGADGKTLFSSEY